jgi:hypothetical protein
MKRDWAFGLLAWVLWSNVSTVGGSAGWQQRRDSWNVVVSTTNETECRTLERQAIESAQRGGTPIPTGRMETASDGAIIRYTFACYPDTIDPRK